MNLEFSWHIFETSSSMKNSQVGAELFHAGGQTDVPKLIVAFLNFANERKEHFFRMLRDSTPFVWNNTKATFSQLWAKHNNFRAFFHFRLLSRKMGGHPENIYCVCTVSVQFSAFPSSPYYLHWRIASNGSDVRSTSSKSSCEVAVIGKMFKQPTKCTSVLRYIVTLKMAGLGAETCCWTYFE